MIHDWHMSAVLPEPLKKIQEDMLRVPSNKAEWGLKGGCSKIEEKTEIMALIVGSTFVRQSIYNTSGRHSA
jgi:hypothetical protein